MKNDKTKYLVTYHQMEGDNYAGGCVKYQKVVDTLEQAGAYETITPITIGEPLSAAELHEARQKYEAKKKADQLAKEIDWEKQKIESAINRLKALEANNENN